MYLPFREVLQGLVIRCGEVATFGFAHKGRFRSGVQQKLTKGSEERRALRGLAAPRGREKSARGRVALGSRGLHRHQSRIPDNLQATYTDREELKGKH